MTSWYWKVRIYDKRGHYWHGQIITMTPHAIIRSAIPGASDELCDHIMWCRTPYPFKKLDARELYRAARRFERADFKGTRLCDFCNNIAVDGWNCKACNAFLSQESDKP